MRIIFCILILLSTLPICRMASGQNAQNTSLYLSGRVVLEDGWPPEARVDILTTCNGRPYVLAHTDRMGLFSFRFGPASNQTAQDASVTEGLCNQLKFHCSVGNPTLQDPMGSPSYTAGTQTTTTDSPQPPAQSSDGAFTRCDIQAKLPGYQSASISLANRKPMDGPDLGTIILHRLTPVEGQLVSVTALAAPKGARKAFEKGRRAVNANRLEDARKDFETAIRADPKYLDPYLQLAALQAVAGQWPEVVATTGAALHLDPNDYPQAYYLNALANFNIRNTDAAETSAREAERLDPGRQFPRSWLVLGRILEVRRQFVEAAAQMREYLKLAPRAPDAAAVRARLAEIEKLM
jgi:hypothetical protein